MKSQDCRHSDTMLLYCGGVIYDDRYLLVAIVWEDTHDFLEKENSKL
ncbi:type II toxin-antitoxin system YafO family toxin [Microbulbifer sp. SSSA002]